MRSATLHIYILTFILTFPIFHSGASSGQEHDIPQFETNLPDWIIPKPVTIDEQRIQLLKEYARLHYGIDTVEIVPRMIVLHWTGSNNLNAALKNFNRSELKGRKFIARFGKANVAVHYLVDRKGKIFKLLPDRLMGRHVIGLNHCAIGIENVGNNNLTHLQVMANAKLIKWLVNRHEKLEYLIGHYEYLSFRNSPLFIEKFPDYLTMKSDPGKKFMTDVRKLLQKENITLKNTPDVNILSCPFQNLQNKNSS